METGLAKRRNYEHLTRREAAELAGMYHGATHSRAAAFSLRRHDAFWMDRYNSAQPLRKKGVCRRMAGLQASRRLARDIWVRTGAPFHSQEERRGAVKKKDVVSSKPEPWRWVMPWVESWKKVTAPGLFQHRPAGAVAARV
jgi:hypothetical protein